MAFKEGHCNRCGSGAVRCVGLGPVTPKPRFKCDQCKDTWYYGYDGGPYLAIAYRYHTENRIEWPERVKRPDLIKKKRKR
jgi:hypothetical protein